jgi:hypothetical protein
MDFSALAAVGGPFWSLSRHDELGSESGTVELSIEVDRFKTQVGRTDQAGKYLRVSLESPSKFLLQVQIFFF